MRCDECKFETNCSLRKIASDITGCTGHSKRRELKNTEVICWDCRRIVDKKEAFQDVRYESIWLCFDCY